MRLALAFLLLAAPAMAQEQRTPEEIQARIQACTEGTDVPGVTARAEEWAAKAGYTARVAELCAAEKGAEATAFAQETQAAFYDQDTEAAALRDCLEDVLGPDALAPGDVCARAPAPAGTGAPPQ